LDMHLRVLASTVGRRAWLARGPSHRCCFSLPFSSSAARDPVRVAIVGSGPSGLYCAKYLLNRFGDGSEGARGVQIDLLDALPTPFGLLRTGVAPDHPEIRAVQGEFEKILRHESCGFYGNVRLGRDVQVGELLQRYSAVVLAYGAAKDARLGAEGEGGENIHAARQFVGWYNGHPDNASDHFALGGEEAVVVGMGNVAVDVARMLVAPPDAISQTDMPTYAVEALSRSNIKRVHMLGRRGPAQAAFSTKELRELSRVPGCVVRVSAEDVEAGLNPESKQEMKEARAVRRKTELVQKLAATEPDAAAEREIVLHFLSAPMRFLLEEGRVAAVEVEKQELCGDAGQQGARGTGKMEMIPADLCFVSIGYQSIAVPDVPFDTQRHVVPSHEGRVCDVMAEEARPGLYVSGWLKRGPVGIIGSNIPDAQETVQAIVADVETGAVPVDEAHRRGVGALLVERGVQFVTKNGWRHIDEWERREGERENRERSKLSDTESLLAAARGDDAESNVRFS
jgi:NADPH-dependent glutamate synthase beta subunit-like oxidoreductase